MGFYERIDTILNWSEQTHYQSHYTLVVIQYTMHTKKKKKKKKPNPPKKQQQHNLVGGRGTQEIIFLI